VLSNIAPSQPASAFLAASEVFPRRAIPPNQQKMVMSMGGREVFLLPQPFCSPCPIPPHARRAPQEQSKRTSTQSRQSRIHQNRTLIGDRLNRNLRGPRLPVRMASSTKGKIRNINERSVQSRHPLWSARRGTVGLLRSCGIIGHERISGSNFAAALAVWSRP
jgi:hypothetical protein